MSNLGSPQNGTTTSLVPDGLQVTDWASVQQYYNDLLKRDIDSLDSLKQWLKDLSDIDTVVSEDFRWRYVNMTRDTTDKEVSDRLQEFYEEIDPNLKTISFKLNTKLIVCPFTKQLDDKYAIYLRSAQKQVDLFREENLPLFKEMSLLEKKYAGIIGAMSIEHDGKTLTIAQAGKLLKSSDRELRETIYRKVNDRRKQDADELENLFDELLKLRHQVALNCGFNNYRDYKFVAMGRFDYTVADCEDFHKSVAEVIVPLVAKIEEEKRQKLGLDVLKPWDTEADADPNSSLAPFSNSEELVSRSIETLAKVKPLFGEVLKDMDQAGLLDLESRAGKAPGGYNMTLPKTGLPFIFMNAAGTDRDVKTMVHEAGHAVHSYLSRDLEILGFKRYPSEVAELASMSMELFTMPYWDSFYPDAGDLQRAQKDQLKGIIGTLPWIANIDKFQHWLYTNPGHTRQQRTDAWLRIYKEFHTDNIDWSGEESVLEILWHKQLHIFEVPFYYIEYGFAQLGAVAMWQQYQADATKAIVNYSAALELGYTQSIPAIYEKAGIEFKFDNAYISSLMDTLWTAYEN